MAFDAKGLINFNAGSSLESPAKALWHYATNDADTVVEANGYFDTTPMRKGDLILASLDLDGTPEVKVYIVSAGTGERDDNDVAITAMLIA